MRAHLLGVGAIFPIAAHVPLNDLELVAAAGLGLLTGFLSMILSVSLYKLEDLFQKLPIHWMWWPAIGGLVVGIGGYFQPRALGVGYDVITDLLNGHIAVSVLFGLFASNLVS